MQRKLKPERNPYVSESHRKTGAGVHGKVGKNAHKANRKKSKQKWKKYKGKDSE